MTLEPDSKASGYHLLCTCLLHKNWKQGGKKKKSKLETLTQKVKKYYHLRSFFLSMKCVAAQNAEAARIHTSYHELFVMVLKYLCVEIRIDRNNFIFPSVNVLQHKKQTMTHFMKILVQKKYVEHKIILNYIFFFSSQLKFPFHTITTVGKDRLVLRFYTRHLSEKGMGAVVIILGHILTKSIKLITIWKI